MVSITDKKTGHKVDLSLNYGMTAYGIGLVMLVSFIANGRNEFLFFGGLLFLIGCLVAKDEKGQVIA